MAYPTAVNDQSTDSVTQSNVSVTGVAPAMAAGNLFIATSQALANAAHNATNSQSQAWTASLAATAAAAASLLSIDTVTVAVGANKIFAVK